MKSSFRIAIFSAISLSLVGCGGSSVKTTPKLYAAPLLSDCIKQVSSELYNNQELKLSAPTIQMIHPETNDLTHLAKSIKSFVSQEPEMLGEYQEKLAQKPNFQIFKVGMQNGKNSISCAYIFSTDQNTNIDLKPLLFKIQSGTKSQYVISQEHINAISPVEYLFALPIKNQGIRLFDLEYTANAKIGTGANNVDTLNRIKDVLDSNDMLEFHTLSDPISQDNTIALANEAVSQVDLPHFVRPNTIHVVVPPNKHVKIDQSETKPDYLARLDKFNEKRYVDADTGINTSSQILLEMKRELGIGTGDSPVENSIDEPNLSIKTSGFTSKELAESERIEAR